MSRSVFSAADGKEEEDASLFIDSDLLNTEQSELQQSAVADDSVLRSQLDIGALDINDSELDYSGMPHSAVRAVLRSSVAESGEEKVAEPMIAMDDSTLFAAEGGDGSEQKSAEEMADENFWFLSVAWQNEKNAPELLQCEEEVVDFIHALIQKREDELFDMNERITKEIKSQGRDAPRSNLEATILRLYEMELERFRYVLGSYMRVRLWKIQKFCLHLVSNEECHKLLTKHELAFARKYYDLWQKHFGRMFLDAMPVEFAKFPEQKMILTPDLDKHVFVKANENIDAFMIEGGTQSVEINIGTVYCLRYREVHKYISDGRMDFA